MAFAQNPEVLPKQEQPFSDAKIGTTYKDSKPGTITLTKAPAGAPKRVDDSDRRLGFGQWGTFGGQVPTPNLDRLAKMGLRYTPLPHHRALLSDARGLAHCRNHHSAGTGVITEIGDAYPGYSGQIPRAPACSRKSCAKVATAQPSSARTTTSLTGRPACGAIRSLAQLAGLRLLLRLHGGEMDQWSPFLFRGTAPVRMEIPKGKEGHYTLNDSLADDASNTSSRKSR